MSCETTFFQQLRKRGFRLTPQREMVLSAMHQMQGFVTADEIYERVRAVSSAVDISTVYRTLDLLHEFRVIATVDTGDDQRRFRLSDAENPCAHLVCRACGEVIAVDPAQIRSFELSLMERHGFEIDLSHLSVPGLCRNCRAS